MTRRQVYAAYELYKRGWSVPMLAEALWEKFGYASVEACQASLFESFYSYKFKLRSANESKYFGKVCKGCGTSLDERTKGCRACRQRHHKRKKALDVSG